MTIDPTVLIGELGQALKESEQDLAGAKSRIAVLEGLLRLGVKPITYTAPVPPWSAQLGEWVFGQVAGVAQLVAGFAAALLLVGLVASAAHFAYRMVVPEQEMGETFPGFSPDDPKDYAPETDTPPS